MAKFNIKVISFDGIPTDFNVKMARGFRVLHNKPKCWGEVCGCKTEHGSYESGNTTIYQSTNTGKYYLVRYFDGCFSEMYVETEGIDWNYINEKMCDVFKENPMKRRDLSWEERKKLRIAFIEKAENILLGMVG